MTKILAWSGGLAVACLCVALGHAQTTILPPACAGKTGEELDRCVRDLTPPTGADPADATGRNADEAQLLNCKFVDRADENFCIARNEIILTCRKRVKNAEFDACVNRLIQRPQMPGATDCAKTVPAQRKQCDLRNKSLDVCLKDPWRYFSCLGGKLYPVLK